MSRSLRAGLSFALIAAAALLSRARRAVGALQPRLAPAGDRVAFSYQGAVWVLPAGGGAMTRLTAGDGLDRSPRLLPWGARAGAVLGPEMMNLA
jgi:tricorn protease